VLFFALSTFLLPSQAQRPAQVTVQEPLQRQQVTPWEPRTAVEPSQIAPSQITPIRSILLSGTTWTAIGPAPLLSNSAANGNVSGRITGIAADPTDANTIYIAPAGGGVWKTTDGGTTWTPLTDTQTTLSMGAIAIAPSNHLVLYAGTGEANNSLDSNFGRGILHSTDGGGTWTLSMGPGGIFNTNRLTCSKIVVDPTNANIAYAAIAAFGNNGAARAANTTGIYKTTDGGTTWTNVTAANGKDSTFDWSDVALDPNTPSTVYAAVGYILGAANNGAYKSTDSGATWTLLNAANAPVGSTFGRITVAISKASNANVLYIAAENNTGSGALARFVRSDDAGVSFNLLSPPNYMGSQGWYDTAVIVDPSSSAIVYVSGSAGTNSILRSATSGGAWTDISGGGVSPHADHHALAFDQNGLLLDGDDGGIYRLADPTVPTWTNLNGNLQTIQFQGIGLHPTNANIAIGGSQDNGIEVYSGALLWTETDGGDGGFAKFNQANGNVAYHQIPNGSFGSNFFRVSLDGGATWTTQTGSGLAGDTNNQQFYAPFVANGNRVLYGTNRIWETTNATVAGFDNVVWTAISAVNVNGWNPSGKFVNAIGLAPSDVNTVYASAHTSGFGATDVFVTTDHGSTWTQHNLPVAGPVKDIQVDPTTSTTAYAVISSFTGAGNVFKTINGGTLWTNISGNLPSEPVWSLQIDPGAAGRLYVGADDGVYITQNGGTTWSRFGAGLPNGQVFQIELNTTLNILAAGIHGRGMWEITRLSPSAAPAEISGAVTTTDGSPLAGVTVGLDGSKSATTITDSAGNYHFDNVDTGSFYTVTPALVNYRFAPANRSFSLVGDKTDAVFTGSPDAALSANTIDTPEYFVRQQYLDFLGREPDQGGFDYWDAQISSCNGDAGCIGARRIDVSAAFFMSPESQETGAFVYGLYAGTLGRTPMFAEFMPDRATVIGGANLAAAKAAFADVFVQRGEFATKYPQTMTRDQFVDALLQTMNARSGVDLSSLRGTLMSDYDSGTTQSQSRSLVVRDAVQASAFAQAEYNKAFVLTEYFAYLRRDPDLGGYNFWVNALNSAPSNYRGMVCSFITSAGYQRRFGAVITHSNAECGQ
jgi:photosystem II stability/assembly factor-like uncharacterized protein